ncbi:MAG: hypothetical protein AAGC96_01860 [Pseudomonadota bacterium]
MNRNRALVTAIVVGYSRLMRVESSITRAALDDIDAELVQPALSEFGGQTLSSAEETTSFEFGDSVQAVLFAISLQLAAGARNLTIREDRRIQYRIGIETIAAGAQTADYDAVEHIACSLSELVEPGRICISSNVRDDIADKLELTIQSLDDVRLMPAPENLEPYEIKLDAVAGAAKAAAEKSPQSRRRSTMVAAALAALILLVIGVFLVWQPLQERGSSDVVASQSAKPSIVVLPFENLATGNEGSMFAHGITASIISALAQVPELFVISSSSAFAFTEQFGGMREIGAEFGVGYVLVGSVQTNSDNIRVIAELSDTGTGETLWTGRYDRSPEDVFAVQDEITLNVLVSLQLALTEGQQAAVRGRGTRSVDAYLGLLRAESEFRKYSRSSMIETRRLLEQVQALDPDYYHALVLEARTHTFDAQWGYSLDTQASLEKAAALLEQAALLDGNMSATERAEIEITQAYVEQMLGNSVTALTLAQEAAEASPNNANLLATAGWVASFDRAYDRSNQYLRSAIAHNPIYPSWYANFLSRNHTFKGEIDKAIEWARDGVSRSENDRRKAWALVNLVFAYMEAGDTDNARIATNEALELWPNMTIETLEKAQPFQYEEDWQRFESALRKNGVPD